MLGISIFDIIGSVSFFFDFLLLPSGASIPGAMGNLQTCKVQGTIKQLSYTGILFNLLLAIYFWLTVSKGWKEHQFEEIRRYAYGAVLLVGVGLALGGIPFYEPLLFDCKLPVPPLFTDSWTEMIFFFFLPFGLSLLGILWATAALFLSVYKLEKSSSKWRLSIRATGDSMTVKVFWRCFWYLLAFLIPWPIYFVGHFVEMKEANFPFVVALQICAPIQGFLNAVVYQTRSNKLPKICMPIQGFWNAFMDKMGSNGPSTKQAKLSKTTYSHNAKNLNHGRGAVSTEFTEN